MKRQSQRIPTIRKQYVQTIYDGLKTQFDQTIKQQLSDQIDIVQTVNSVYEDSFKAQSSIINFLSQAYKQKCSVLQQNFKQNVSQLKIQLNQLQQEQNKQRKSIIISSLNGKIQQAYDLITVLNSALQEVKSQNEDIEKKYQDVQMSKDKMQEQLNERKMQYEKIVAKMAIMEQEIIKNKQQYQSRLQKVIHEAENLAQQNKNVKKELVQSQIKIQCLEIQNKQNILKLSKAVKKIQTISTQNAELLILKQQNQKLITSLQQQLQLVLKFTNVQQKKCKKLKKKISLRESININASTILNNDLEKLKQFSTEIEQFKGLINKSQKNQQLQNQNSLHGKQQQKLHQNAKQTQQAEQIGQPLSRCGSINGQQMSKLMLDKITEKAQQQRNSQNSLPSSQQIDNQLNNYNKSSKTEKKINTKVNQKSQNFIISQFISETLCKQNSYQQSSSQNNKIQDAFKTFSASKNNNKSKNLLMQIRKCQSQNDDSNQNSDDQNEDIDSQIQQIKGLWHRISVDNRSQRQQLLNSSLNDSQSFYNTSQQFYNDCVSPAINVEMPKIAIKIKQKISKTLRQNQKRTSSILSKLESSHITSLHYQEQLQTQLALMQKKLQIQHKNYTNEQQEYKQKIDELMDRIESMEQDRIRNQNKVTNKWQQLQKLIRQKEQQIQQFSSKIQILTQQNGQFAQVCQTSKLQLESEKRKADNLEQQIKQLNAEKQKIYNEKNKLQFSYKFQYQQKKKLIDELHNKQKQLQQIINKNLQISLQFERKEQAMISLQKKQKNMTQDILKLQQSVHNLSQSGKENLQEIEKLRAKIKQLKNDKVQLQTSLSEINQKLQKSNKYCVTLQKTNEDIKYMNQIFKKDIIKIKQIEQKDWDKQYQKQDESNVTISPSKSRIVKIQNPGSQKTSSILNKNTSNQLCQRPKNYSFTSGNSKFNSNIASSTFLDKYTDNYTIGSNNKNKSFGQNFQNLQSLTTSRVNLNKGYNIDFDKQNSYLSKGIHKKVDTKACQHSLIQLDLDSIKTKANLKIKSNNQSSELGYSKNILTDRPITELIKKKYNMY